MDAIKIYLVPLFIFFISYVMTYLHENCPLPTRRPHLVPKPQCSETLLFKAKILNSSMDNIMVGEDQKLGRKLAGANKINFISFLRWH